MSCNLMSHVLRKRNYKIQNSVRHLRTQCVRYLPRGYANYERRRISHAREVEEEYGVTTEKEKPKARRDTRSIDSVDPVVLKYTNMVNELRIVEHISEKVFQTNFGNIRFDNDNVPVVHGQYDDVFGPDMKVFMKKKLSDLGIKTDEDINDEANNDSSLDNNFVSQTSTMSPQQSGISFTQNTSEVGTESCTSASGNNTTLDNENDIKYIDDIYFGTTMERYSKTYDNQGLEFNKVTTAGSKSDTSDLNYIDECVFGDSLSRHGESHDYTLDVPQKPIDNDRQQYRAKNDSNNLNYIDKIYFQDSLETLNESQNPAAGVSEVNDNFENYLFDSKSESRTKSKDIESTVDSSIDTEQENHIPVMQPYRAQEKSKEEEASRTHVKKAEEKAISKSQVADTLPKSAFEYVVKKRRELHNKSHGIDPEQGAEGKKGLNKILSLLNERKKKNCTRYEICKLLKHSVIYDKYDIVGLYKPYGMSMHGGQNSPYHVLLDYLPDLAKHLKAEKLHPVHRLDANTTGVLLMARTPAMANTLKEMFKERQLKKIYWAITKGIPNPLQGVIDIPIAEGVIDCRRRMILKPDVEGQKSSRNSHLAVTVFRVLAKCNSSAFVELSPMTGVKHQIRVHLGFGLSCPVLGDHKYSHLQKVAPQRLPGDILDHMQLKQSKVRELPMFLHSRSIVLPEIVDGRNIMIEAKLPAFFNKALSFLELNKKQSHMRYDGCRSLD